MLEGEGGWKGERKVKERPGLRENVDTRVA